MALLFFWGLARVPMAQAIALAFVAPLIALYLAAVILKERIDRRRDPRLPARLRRSRRDPGRAGRRRTWAGRPCSGALSILASAGLYAWNIILMRQQAQLAGPVEIAFFTGLIIAACFSPPRLSSP